MTAQSWPRRVLLARHCETDWNAQGRLQGRTNTSLNLAGFAQAESQVQLMRELGVTRVLCSSERRAVETAAIYAGVTGREAELDAGFRELDHGDWEGQYFADLLGDDESSYGAWLENPLDVAIPGSTESAALAQARFLSALCEHAEDASGEVLLVVSHKHMIALARCALEGRNGGAFLSLIDDGRRPHEVSPQLLFALCKSRS